MIEDEKKVPRPRIKEFKPWMIDAIKMHILTGHSLRSFTGYYSIDPDLFGKWLKEIPELREINGMYKAKIQSKRSVSAPKGRGCTRE